MTDAREIDAQREDFHRLVDMASAEPAARVRARDARENTGPLPGDAGTPAGGTSPRSRASGAPASPTTTSA
jgi:hypothetical protein